MKKPAKNPHAVAMAKARADALSPARRREIAEKAGKAGGKARAKKMTKAQRSESARKAAAARWAKVKKKD
jgi:hypothetical protein